VLGTHPSDGEEIVALNGRYGPYIKKGSDTRSLDAEEQLFTVDLDAALALLAEPKRRRGQRAAAAPLRELGPDPASGENVVVKEGRFGPYVTDGTTNASLRKGDTVDGVTLERAAELLQERRQSLPPPQETVDVVGGVRRERRRFPIFGYHSFVRLWAAQVISSLGDWIGLFAVLALAARIGKSSPETAVGVVMIARMIPGFFLASVGGVLVDRWSRKKVMVTCDIGRGMVMASLPFIHTVWGLFLASLLLEILSLL